MTLLHMHYVYNPTESLFWQQFFSKFLKFILKWYIFRKLKNKNFDQNYSKGPFCMMWLSIYMYIIQNFYNLYFSELEKNNDIVARTDFPMGSMYPGGPAPPPPPGPGAGQGTQEMTFTPRRMTQPRGKMPAYQMDPTIQYQQMMHFPLMMQQYQQQQGFVGAAENQERSKVAKAQDPGILIQVCDHSLYNVYSHFMPQMEFWSMQFLACRQNFFSHGKNFKR